MELALAHASSERAAHRIRLLVDLFQREVRIAAFLSCLGIPIDRQRLALDRRAIQAGERDALRAQRDHLALIDDQHAPGMLEQSGNVRGQILLVLAQANDQRTTASARAHQQVGLL